MSEHQIVAFRAIDGPVSQANLAYMRKQSTRAEITPWSFDNEYHYGDFRGNAVEMMRRGYDLHVYYADFGIRKLLIQLPVNLPSTTAAKPYFAEGSLKFIKDKQGSGGILIVEPFLEPGDLEDLWEFDELIPRLLPLRAEILDGDLRPLYLAHLAMACDGNHDRDETIEPPLPAGMGDLSDAQSALAELFGLSSPLLAAIAQDSPPLATKAKPTNQHAEWLQHQTQAVKDEWLAQWMADPHSSVRSTILAEFNKSQLTPTWPTVRRERTIGDLEAAADVLEKEAAQKATEKASHEKAKLLADIAANPERFLHEVEKLVKERTNHAYEQAVQLLADVRESLAGTNQSTLAEQHAQKLRKEYSRRGNLVAELRRQGLLGK